MRGSIARRVVRLVLAVEVLAALGVTGFAFFYERHAHFRAFDIALRGRADTVMGAVEDADDAKLGVMLDTTDLRVPGRDVYAVREEGGGLLGSSGRWVPEAGLWAGRGVPLRCGWRGGATAGSGCAGCGWSTPWRQTCGIG